MLSDAAGHSHNYRAVVHQDGRELGDLCRAAVDRWFGRAVTIAWIARALAAAVAAERYARRPPRPAAADGRLLLPGMRRNTWFRLARLMVARAERKHGRARPGPKPKPAQVPPGDPESLAARAAAEDWRRAFTAKGVRQMVALLGDYTDDHGRIDNTGRFLACYSKTFACKDSAAYEHWRAVRRLGLVRQTRHSAGHRADAATRCARYVLSWPAARLPSHLPDETDRPLSGPLDAAADAWNEFAGVALADADDTGLYRYGSCRYAPSRAEDTGDDRTDSAPPVDNEPVSTYYLEAFPLYARVPPPSPRQGTSWARGEERSGRPGEITDDERLQAAAILNRCRSQWARQGQQLAEHDANPQLISMIALVLRYSAHAHPGDVVDILTERVKSAKGLAGLLRYRLQRVLGDLRRRRGIKVDDNDELYNVKARKLCMERTKHYEASAAQRAATRAAMEAGRARSAVRSAAQRDPAVTARPRITEPEDAFDAELVRCGLKPAPGSAIESARLTTAESAALYRARLTRNR